MIDEKDLIPLIQKEKKWCPSNFQSVDYYKGWNDALDAIIAIMLREMERKF